MQNRVENFPANGSLNLTPNPVPPVWVREGAPRAALSTLWKSDDRTATTMVWECTAGKFDWYYSQEETVHIIDGSVNILLDDGRELCLGPADTAVFKAGSHAVWTVPKYVRKVAILRHSLPAVFTYPLLAMRKLKGMARAALAARRGSNSAIAEPLAEG